MQPTHRRLTTIRASHLAQTQSSPAALAISLHRNPLHKLPVARSAASGASRRFSPGRRRAPSPYRRKSGKGLSRCAGQSLRTVGMVPMAAARQRAPCRRRPDTRPHSPPRRPTCPSPRTTRMFPPRSPVAFGSSFTFPSAADKAERAGKQECSRQRRSIHRVRLTQRDKEPFVDWIVREGRCGHQDAPWQLSCLENNRRHKEKSGKR